MKRDYIGLDFETYSDVDLFKHGLDRYVESPHFQPLLAGLSWGLGNSQHIVDLFKGDEESKQLLASYIGGRYIVAHNAGFERAVLGRMGLVYPADRFIDSAVVARAAGAAGKLEAAGPQLLGVDKMPEGKALIMKFCVPTEKYQYLDNDGVDYDPRFNTQVIEDNPKDWQTFKEYCRLDAFLGLRLVTEHGHMVTDQERMFNAITMEMNETGWPVDVELVEEMHRQAEQNKAEALAQFQVDTDSTELNLASMPQLKEWCAKRGIRANSFDEKNVAKMLERITLKLESDDSLNREKTQNYEEVQYLLQTKQILGGSSLSKLPKILDLVGEDGRLRDQYLHCGAGQTLRTSGRGVQMQNLKRIGEPDDVTELLPPALAYAQWDNTKLAKNIRQVFTASDPNGALIVGDFSSVEGRGLAWLAGEGWKLDAYRKGQDLYKVLAQKIYSVDYDDVTKVQRQTGKVGELSCGYGAGGSAVQEFAQNMGVNMSEGEAATLVKDWRAANPKIENFWATLDEMLHSVFEGSPYQQVSLPDGFRLTLETMPAPMSLRNQVGMPERLTMRSLAIIITDSNGDVFMRRVIHGLHRQGRGIGYYKPSELKNGDLWKNWYINPKTKRREYYTIYGGKLAGIITQSFCRELFFQCLINVKEWVDQRDNIQLVGQFHDEIVLDWVPAVGASGINTTKVTLEQLMSDPGKAKSFPLAAEIKSDYRYTK